MIWEWVKDDRTHIFRSTIPLTQNCSTITHKSDLTVGTGTYCSTVAKERMAYITGRWKKRGKPLHINHSHNMSTTYCRTQTAHCSLHSIVSWITLVDEQQWSWLSYIKDYILSTEQRQIKQDSLVWFGLIGARLSVNHTISSLAWGTSDNQGTWKPWIFPTTPNNSHCDHLHYHKESNLGCKTILH